LRVTFLKSAGVLIEGNGARLLCDPWLLDGAYYGSWAHAPPCDVTPEEIGALSGIYISHIHPDHLHAESLTRFPRGTPVYIHRYAWRHLAEYIESLGFIPTEVANAESVDLGGLSLTIYAADNCDPSLCGRVFGCDARVGAERPGSVQIDSLAVVSDGKRSIVNVNDCPFALARPAADAILARFGAPDFLLTNYVGAGPYPQCFANLTSEEKADRAAEKREQFLFQAQGYIKLFRPKAFMPFAGTYTLAGHLVPLNRYRGTPALEDAAELLGNRCPQSQCVYLTTRQTYDLETGQIEGDPEVWTVAHQYAYEHAVLAKRVLDYEREPMHSDLLPMLTEAARRFRQRCHDVGFRTPTKIYVQNALSDPDSCFLLPTNGGTPRQVSGKRARDGSHLIVSADSRLLKWLLEGPEGPHRAHWEEASIGSHITFERDPDVYERGLYFCLNDLHI